MIPKAATTPFLEDSTDIASKALRERGFGEDNVAEWAWILSGKGPDEMLERLISIPSATPTFVVLQILQRDILKVMTLKRIIVYVWEHIITRAQDNVLEASVSDPEMKPGSSRFRQSPELDDATFMTIISHLLYHTRRIWPTAMPCISHMVGPYMYSVLARNDCGSKVLDARLHRRFCRVYNAVMHLLTLPASIDPLKSMAHNWSAQKVVLALGDEFEPSLLPDEDSYRAVIHVMAALGKSEKESKVSTLRSRSWPPWRVAQDGMDAQRSPEEDMSRVAMAIARKRGSGYVGTPSQDEALRIFGGQEFDGTPTIHTRKLVKMRSGRRNGPLDTSKLDSKQWAARIEATRDVREAWSAFSEYHDLGGRPTMAMYSAMFTKLAFEGARIGRTVSYEAAPGDGKEVLPVADDNFSTSYKLHHQPPALDDLYDQMIDSGIRPSGQCLIQLLGHASSVQQGLRYLRDSKLIDGATVASLSGNSSASKSSGALRKVPTPVFSAWISLLCRFAPQLRADRDGSDGEAQSFDRAMAIKEKPRSGSFQALSHAADLLKQRHTTSRPAWYALFHALARRNAIIARDETDDAQNDVLAWQVLAAALRDFHKCGLELDPRGFQIICDGFCKAVLASKSAMEHGEAVLDDVLLLKAEFTKISTSEPGPYQIPRLFHSLGGVHLHAYVRVLGVTEDWYEMIMVLEWMVHHHEELNSSAQLARNGARHIRQVLVAMKVFLGGTGYECDAQRLAETVENWDGWPEDFEAEQYLERWRNAGRSAQ
ncbi:uncharacterized protein BP5553_09272 [Venustampulla echinocandica]|uniref:Uncharacterized protein n=1 Tax=Venustampulla echinocandica TaxID=2656787 RepID=A0A370TC87_9HELO|nr:uncharacterized protein BP5553_09272 [Venustampulla echinocandica]RDL31870.1 hypothetical protein BP5553_09272 [Venustampulla echinocandica]